MEKSKIGYQNRDIHPQRYQTLDVCSPILKSTVKGLVLPSSLQAGLGRLRGVAQGGREEGDADSGPTWASRTSHSSARRPRGPRSHGKNKRSPRAALAGSVPVFWGPMTRNFGKWSHVFSLDQMSLCRLSSQGFCKEEA